MVIKFKNAGFTLIEIMIAVALVGIFLPAMGTVISSSVFSTKQGEDFSRAASLARENMEAVYFIKKDQDVWDWVSTPQNTSAGEYYQPSVVSGNWELGEKTTSPVEVDGFTSTVNISSVCRDSVNFKIVDCSSAGAHFVDDTTRIVRVKVHWNERGEEQNVELYGYVTSN